MGRKQEHVSEENKLRNRSKWLRTV